MPETAQETGADAFVRALPEHGVEVMFGLPPARTRSLRRWPDEHDVRAAVALIAAAERPILVLGSDAAGASEDARALANELELPVFTAERSQLAELPFPARDPHNFAQYGEHPQLIADSDCVVAIGMRVFQPFSSSHTLRLPAAATFIHAHAEPEYVGWNVEPDVGLAADPQPALRALVKEASHDGISVATRSARAARLDAMRKAFADDIARDRTRYAGAGPGEISLIDVADELSDLLENDALIFDEAITSSLVLLRHCRFPDRARVMRNAGGSLGWALPAAIGAKIAQPKRQVVALVGDGSFHFAPQALWTAAQEAAPVVVIICDNRVYLSVKVSIEHQLPGKENGTGHPGTAFPSLDQGATARSYGAQARRITTSADLQPALTWALERAETSRVLTISVPEVR